MKSLVMIVDDHAVIRRMLRVAFEPEDLQVCDAVDGAEGVRKAQELKPKLIILDLSMPVMNGLEAARALKLLMPHVPLLMFTNNAGVVEKEARSEGIFAVVCKSDSDVSAIVGPRKGTSWAGRSRCSVRFVTDWLRGK